MVAISTYTSPGTSLTCASSAHWPRDSTSSTPAIDSTAPAICRFDALCAKNRLPIASIHTGLLAATSVTLSGVEVLSARYCSAL